MSQKPTSFDTTAEQFIRTLTDARMDNEVLRHLGAAVRAAGGRVAIPKTLFEDIDDFVLQRRVDFETDSFVYTVRRKVERK